MELKTERGRIERPLATFVIVAYNQEAFIRKAVEAAFSQTYSPLQIILSDDASPDRTSDIMREMAEAYAGPHDVLLNRNERNVGLVEHLNRVFAMARGEWIIAAAGDDVSSPLRTEAVMTLAIAKPAIRAVFSNRFLFSCDEELQEFSQCAPRLSALQKHLVYSLQQVVDGGGYLFPGATWAYQKECYTFFGKLPREVYCEDRILPLRAALLGSVAMIQERLVAHRQSASSLGVKQWHSVDIVQMWFTILNYMIQDVVRTAKAGAIDEAAAARLVVELARTVSTIEYKKYIRSCVASGGMLDNLALLKEMLRRFEVTGVVYWCKKALEHLLQQLHFSR